MIQILLSPREEAYLSPWAQFHELRKAQAVRCLLARSIERQLPSGTELKRLSSLIPLIRAEAGTRAGSKIQVPLRSDHARAFEDWHDRCGWGELLAVRVLLAREIRDGLPYDTETFEEQYETWTTIETTPEQLSMQGAQWWAKRRVAVNHRQPSASPPPGSPQWWARRREAAHS